MQQELRLLLAQTTKLIVKMENLSTSSQDYEQFAMEETRRFILQTIQECRGGKVIEQFQ